MAVDMTDIQSLLKNVDLKSILGDSTMAETTGGLGIGGGVLGAVLVGALLPRLLGDQNGTAAALAAEKTLSTADVQSIVTGAQNSQTLGNVAGEIWKAEGQVQAALQAATNAAQISTLNAEIANLQGQSLITKSISDAAAMNATQHGLVIQATQDAATNLLAATNSGFYATAQVVNNDGEKTRALIQGIATADLNRQIVVAQNEATELRHDEQIELIKLSTQILYKLMDSNRIIEDALTKLNQL